MMPLSSFVIFKVRNQPCLHAARNLVKEKEKAGEALTQCHLHSSGLGFGQN